MTYRHKGGMLADSRSMAAEDRRQEFLRILGETGSIQRALDAAGVGRPTYERWRSAHPAFAARATELRLAGRDRDAPWDGTFADFRQRFFGHATPWFHQRTIDVLERAKPLSVTLLLWPPGHAKSTLLVDWCSYKLAVDPSFRITMCGESQSHARKMLRRVRNRMEADSPHPGYVARWGPFAPQQATDRKGRQPWGADFFDVYKKAAFDEADYSMVAWGYGGAVIGSRTDLIVIDDVQSTSSLNLTPKIFETITQDWLSRMIGSDTNVHCVIIGSRVGDDDIYQSLVDQGRVDDVIAFSAHHPADRWPAPVGRTAKEKRTNPDNLPPTGTRLLWDRYSPQTYLDMRVNAGEQAWARNFLQRPVAAGDATFSDELIDKVRNPLRSVNHPAPDGVPLVISVDPSIGGRNATMVAAMTPERLIPLHWRVDVGLTNNRQIFSIVEDYRLTYPLNSLTDLVIEDKAFQRGLLDDDALSDIRDRYGFRVTGHQTSSTKNDDNIGIPGIARSFERNEIDLPGADDDRTVYLMDLLRNELVRWRPFKRGSHLQQDLVMVLYFAWIRWRQLRATLDAPTDAIRLTSIPWTPTRITIGVGLPPPIVSAR